MKVNIILLNKNAMYRLKIQTVINKKIYYKKLVASELYKINKDIFIKFLEIQ